MLNNSRKFDYKNFFVVLVFENAANNYRFLQALQASVIVLVATAAIAYNYVTSYTVVPMVSESCQRFVVNTFLDVR